MRWPQTLTPTMKESPEGAEIPSHVLMLRAGLIEQVMAGAYSYLPLGLRALKKGERVGRDEKGRADRGGGEGPRRGRRALDVGHYADRPVGADRPRGGVRQRADQLQG